MFLHNNIIHINEDTQEMPQLCNIHKKDNQKYIQKKRENGGLYL